MFYTRSHVRALEAQIDYLKAELEKSHLQANALLDRLLQRHNIEPVRPSPQPVTPEPTQLISPFGQVNTPEMAEAFRESWTNEEAAYLMAEEGYADGQAREMAERRFISQHKAL